MGTEARRTLDRGELVRALYRLGRQGGSGVLTVGGAGPRDEVFVLRRGAVVVSEGEFARRALQARLARLVALDRVTLGFAGGVTAYPPGAPHQVSLAGWARAHLEQQLDSTLGDALVRELAGVRLSIRPELAPEVSDEADRRMVLAMDRPRRLDQIWPLARTPRFRLLAFLHFLRGVDALVLEGVVAEKSSPTRTIDPRREAARRVLGLPAHADAEAVKRAYRRLARSLHPDLQPDADGERRRALERKFAEVTAAYETLI
ncbi:MAG: J domain-containing protein [Acidobacteriota bacterium]